MRACLNNWRGSPRKFNEYLRAVRGLYAFDAVNKLQFMPSPYAYALKQLISSAMANASENASIMPNNLVISEATVGRATFFKRVCFRGRGRTGRVTKFGSNVLVILKDANDTSASNKVAKPAKEKSAKGVETKTKEVAEKPAKSKASKGVNNG